MDLRKPVPCPDLPDHDSPDRVDLTPFPRAGIIP